jgi:hypothetical protein
VDGSFTTDNRALIIKTDAGDKIYQNSKIELSVTDSAGEPVTAGVTYDAKILYKGQDINELGGKTYYSVDRTQGVITLNGKTTPLPEANYQLYVTASRLVAIGGYGEPVISSQTFNVKLEDRLATPTTQVALYNKSSSDYKYSFYLTDESDMETADLSQETTYSSSKGGIAFDSNGKFYMLNNNKLISNNTDANNSDLSSEISSYYNNGFIIDVAKNMSYAYGINELSLYFFKYPSLIANGTTTDVVPYGLINESDYYWQMLAVDNGLLYIYATKTIDSVTYDYIITYNISSGSTAKKIKEFAFTNYMTSEMGLSNPAINDIFAMEGAVYILVSESSNGTSSDKNIYRRGSVIKYVVSLDGTESATHMKNDIKATPTIEKTDIKKMTLYYVTGSRSSDLYTDGNERNSVVTIDGLPSKDYTEKTAQELLFPDVYALSKDNANEPYLSSPAKVIAVKPKKLVIADDGIAFYTENDGCLSYKNLNRVVTIDLEEFVVESVQTTAAKFDSEISRYLWTSTSLEPLASGGTVVASQEQGYFYVGSGDTWIPINKAAGESNADTSKTYLSVKPGTTE